MISTSRFLSTFLSKRRFWIYRGMFGKDDDLGWAKIPIVLPSKAERPKTMLMYKFSHSPLGSKKLQAAMAALPSALGSKVFFLGIERTHTLFSQNSRHFFPRYFRRFFRRISRRHSFPEFFATEEMFLFLKLLSLKNSFILLVRSCFFSFPLTALPAELKLDWREKIFCQYEHAYQMASSVRNKRRVTGTCFRSRLFGALAEHWLKCRRTSWNF